MKPETWRRVDFEPRRCICGNVGQLYAGEGVRGVCLICVIFPLRTSLDGGKTWIRAACVNRAALDASCRSLQSNFAKRLKTTGKARR